MAQSKEAALKAQTLLSSNSILVRTRTLGSRESFYEVMVPEESLTKAQLILINAGL